MGCRAGARLNVLVDTHALVWWFGDRSRLSPTATDAITTAERILISPITWWEIGLLARDERIRLDRPLGAWVTGVMQDPRSVVAPLTPEAAAWAGAMPARVFPGDPADRMLYATARDLRVALVSKDRRLQDHARSTGEIDVIW